MATVQPAAGELRPSGSGELGAAGLLPSDPRTALVLLNEARYYAIQGTFGVRRDQVNVMSLVAAIMLAEAVGAKALRVRRLVRGTTRSDLILADGVMNALGQAIAGPSAGQIPFLAPLVGTAAAAAVGAQALRWSSREMKAASEGLKRSFRLFAPLTRAALRQARSSPRQQA